MESKNSDIELVHRLRASLKEIDSPLVRMVEGMDDDSLKRIDYAFNLVGVDYKILGYVKEQADSVEIFRDIEALVKIENGIEKTKAADVLRIKILEKLP